MPTHPLHIAVADAMQDVITNKNLNLKLVLDEAAGGTHQLPFFLDKATIDRTTQVSKVDIMILKNDEVVLVCEIEETSVNPTQIYGKVFSTGAAKVCRLANKNVIKLGNAGTFIQILSLNVLDRKLNSPENSKKELQGKQIESSIRRILNNSNLWLKEYYLFWININECVKKKHFFLSLEKILTQL